MTTLKVILLLTVFCCYCYGKTSYFGYCEFGQRKNTQECITGSSCPSGQTFISSSFSYCYPPGAVCCEKRKPVTCGTVTPAPRIGGGFNSLQCSTPWQVSLRRRVNQNQPISKANSEHICGATLIDNQWIITSPFCLYFAGAQQPGERIEENILVVAGDWDHARSGERFRGQIAEQEFRVSNWRVHPNFPSVTSFLDITDMFIRGGEASYQANAFVLVRLDKPMTYSDCVRPICLPDAMDASCGSNTCKITGWGHNENDQLKNILQEAPMTIFSTESCDAIDYYRFNGQPPARPAQSTCARSIAGSFPCVGDQGGPLACQGSNGRWTLRGTILAKMQCDADTPLPVADIAQAVNWIKSVI